MWSQHSAIANTYSVLKAKFRRAMDVPCWTEYLREKRK